MEQKVKPGSSALPILLTLFFGGGFTLFLVIVSGGFFLWVPVAFFGIFGLGLFHYFLWGKGLDEEVAFEREEEKRTRLDDDWKMSEEDYQIRRF